MKTHIMLDLETLGTRPGCVIASIGAVKFSKADGIIERFYTRIDIVRAVEEGFVMDPNTVKWWLSQSPEAQAELIKPEARSTIEALWGFNDFINEGEPVIWGNGASFDNAIMAGAYSHMGLALPWKFWNDRCYRTLKSMHPELPMPKRVGTHHNALDDAESQALHLITLPSFLEV